MSDWFDGHFALGALTALAALALAIVSIRGEREERAEEGKGYPRYGITVIGLLLLFLIQIGSSAGRRRQLRLRRDGLRGSGTGARHACCSRRRSSPHPPPATLGGRDHTAGLT